MTLALLQFRIHLSFMFHHIAIAMNSHHPVVLLASPLRWNITLGDPMHVILKVRYVAIELDVESANAKFTCLSCFITLPPP